MTIEYYRKKEILGEKILVFTPLLYSIGFVFKEYLGGLSMLISFAALLLFIYGYFLIKHKSVNSLPVYCAYALAYYAIISLIFTLHRSYDGYRSMFLNPALILPYVVVLLTTRRYDYNILKLVIYSIEISAILFIIFSIANFSSFLSADSGKEAIREYYDNSVAFDTVSKNFASCVGLGLLLANFLKSRTFLVLAAAFSINLFIAIFLGRRNIIFTNCLYLLAACYLYVRYSGLPKILKFFLIIVGISAASYTLLNLTTYLKDSDSALFNTLSERIDIDSRGMTLYYYDEDMNSSPLNWIIGKGIDSTYYCPGIEETSYRRTVEAGWRQIIMKVGVIGFVLYLLILLPAVFKKKRNLLTKGCGMYILIGLIELYPAGVPSFYLQYILLWIVASICYDSKFASLSDQLVKSKILANKKL